MKQFMAFVKKEFVHVLRDRKTLLILIGMPIMQILLFGFAMSNEIKKTKVVIVDQAIDNSSAKLIARIDASEYFDAEIRDLTITDFNIEAAFKKGDLKILLIIPPSFESEILHEGSAQLRIIADASDPNTASLLTTYLSSIIQDFQKDNLSIQTIPYNIEPQVRMIYNPQLLSAHNFVPGVMALVLMLVFVMMTAITIVREKELGTMEVLLVSPYKPALVMISKTVPYLALSWINLVTIVLLGVFVMGLPFNGSVLLLFAESTLFILTCLTIGIFISNITSSQQVAMLISLMGMMLPTVLLSGFVFPLENMPKLLQWISNVIPARWYYVIVKDIMIKGTGFMDILKETIALLTITAFFFIMSIKKFKQRLA